MSKFVAGHVTKMWFFFFKTTHCLFQNRNFTLKENVEKMSVPIKRLTRYKQKAVLAAMLEGKSMRTVLGQRYFIKKCFRDFSVMFPFFPFLGCPCRSSFCMVICMDTKTRSPKTTAKLMTTTCIAFYSNILAGHTRLLKVYRCYWIYDGNYHIV